MSSLIYLKIFIFLYRICGRPGFLSFSKLAPKLVAFIQIKSTSTSNEAEGKSGVNSVQVSWTVSSENEEGNTKTTLTKTTENEEETTPEWTTISSTSETEKPPGGKKIWNYVKKTSD